MLNLNAEGTYFLRDILSTDEIKFYHEDITNSRNLHYWKKKIHIYGRKLVSKENFLKVYGWKLLADF